MSNFSTDRLKGYQDGWRLLDKKTDAQVSNHRAYLLGYDEGKADKEHCEAYSDEALGVEGYGP